MAVPPDKRVEITNGSKSTVIEPRTWRLPDRTPCPLHSGAPDPSYIGPVAEDGWPIGEQKAVIPY